jgi:hypothetical protein
MAKIKNVSPLGDMFIPALGVEIKAGATFDVSNNDLAASLLAQSDNWTAADKAAVSVTPTTPDTPAQAN